nr:hypothetical protein [Pseudomonas sp. AP42]
MFFSDWFNGVFYERRCQKCCLGFLWQDRKGVLNGLTAKTLLAFPTLTLGAYLNGTLCTWHSRQASQLAG